MKKFSGEILKLKREELNLSIAEISNSTKISKRILKKIEGSDFTNISSFQRKYLIKNYATFLGINNEVGYNKRYKDFITEEEDLKIITSNASIIKNSFLRLLLLFVVMLSAITLYFYYEKDKTSYFDKLTSINNHLSSNSLKEINKDSLTDYSLIDNIQLEKPEMEPVSKKDIYVDDISPEILFLNFRDEVWIEIANDQEIIISGVFQESDEINLEVIKEDSVFITSGNLGLITIKTKHYDEKALGMNGEIGRKKLF